MLCLGISLFSASLWVLPKDVMIEGWREGYEGISSQHGGGSGTDTAWLSVNPLAQPGWLVEWGGELSEALALIAKVTGQYPLT